MIQSIWTIRLSIWYGTLIFKPATHGIVKLVYLILVFCRDYITNVNVVALKYWLMRSICVFLYVSMAIPCDNIQCLYYADTARCLAAILPQSTPSARKWILQQNVALAAVAEAAKVVPVREFPAQRASNAENVSIWWRHHVGNHKPFYGPKINCPRAIS